MTAMLGDQMARAFLPAVGAGHAVPPPSGGVICGNCGICGPDCADCSLAHAGAAPQRWTAVARVHKECSVMCDDS